jgi:hypothetical protein
MKQTINWLRARFICLSIASASSDNIPGRVLFSGSLDGCCAGLLGYDIT